MEGILILIFILIIGGGVYMLSSWATGMNIKNKWGQTISSPEDLPDLINSARKLVDKKYKMNSFLKNDWKLELKKTIKPIEDKLYVIMIFRYNKRYGYKQLKYESEILELIGINRSDHRSTNFSDEELVKLLQLERTLEAKKGEVINEYKRKYDRLN